MRTVRHRARGTALCLALLAGPLGALSPPDERSTQPPANLLLITADTLRPDALGWVSGGDWTPHLDRLAREGFRFPAAVSPTPLTLPAHTSIFTGLDPRRHGVRDNGRRVGPHLALLSDSLRRGGYHTAAFVSGFPLQRMFGLARGFEHYDDSLTEGEGAWMERPAEATSAAAAAWLAQAPEPWFVWVHYYDPHLPYTPPDGLRQSGPRGAYDGEVAGMDRAIGALLAAADGAGSRPRLTVFASDHGESLGEHGEASHGYFIYDSTMLVPMIWHLPGRVAAGESRAGARLTDVAPTILELLGLAPLEGIDGVSLGPTLEGEAQTLPAAYIETWQPWLSYGWSPLKAVRLDGWKLIAAPRPELYDLTSDPGEEHNLVHQERRRARQLKQAMDAVEESAAATAETVADPEVLEQLAALGYLGSGRSAGEPPAGLADPKDRLALRDSLTEADELLRGGRPAAAIERFEQVLKEDPENRFALSRSGEALLRTGDVTGAVARLSRVVAIDPDQPEVRSLLAEALMQSGQFAASAEQWMELIRLQPASARAWSNLGAALGRAGDLDRAIDAMTRAAELAPDDPDRLTRLAFAEHAGGRSASAADHLEQAAALRGEAFSHSAALGLILLQLDRLPGAREWIARSRASEPEFVEAQLQLALAELAGGDREAAARAVRLALAARPEIAARLRTDPRLSPLIP